MGGMSRIFLWKNIGTFGGSQEMFCKVCGPHFDISGDVDIVVVFQKLFYLTLINDIVHIEQDKMCVVHVSAKWHITKLNTTPTRFLHFSGSLALNEYEVPAKIFQNLLTNLTTAPKISAATAAESKYCHVRFSDSMERLSLKQYIPLKAAIFGITSYEMHRCSTRYVWAFEIYTVQEMELQDQFV